MLDTQVKKAKFQSGSKKGIRAILESNVAFDKSLDLQKAAEKFCIMLASSFGKIIGSSVKCTISGPILAKLEKTENNAWFKETGDLFVSYSEKSSKTKICIGLSNGLAFSLIENLLGSSNREAFGEQHAKLKDQFPTLIEQIVIKKAATIILAALEDGFSLSTNRYVAEHINTSFDFDVFCSNVSVSYLPLFIESKYFNGALSIVFPFIQKQTISSSSAPISLSHLNAPSDAILHNLKDTIFSLDGTICDKGLKNLSELLKLKVGETLILDHNIGEDIFLQCQGFAIAQGKVGESRSRIAVSVSKMLA